MPLTPNEIPPDWEPGWLDFQKGNMLMITEAYNPLSLPRLYTALLYSILSAGEKFGSHKKMFEEFLCAELYEAQDMLDNLDTVENIVQKYGKKEYKLKAIESSAKVWNELGVRRRILEDPERRNGKVLRKELVDSMYGMGYKIASLFLRKTGYEDLVPVDLWQQKFCESKGYIHTTDKKKSTKKSGLTPRQNLLYEETTTEFAKQYNVTPAHLQATVYATWSTWLEHSGAIYFFEPDRPRKSVETISENTRQQLIELQMQWAEEETGKR